MAWGQERQDQPPSKAAQEVWKTQGMSPSGLRLVDLVLKSNTESLITAWTPPAWHQVARPIQCFGRRYLVLEHFDGRSANAIDEAAAILSQASLTAKLS